MQKFKQNLCTHFVYNLHGYYLLIYLFLCYVKKSQCPNLINIFLEIRETNEYILRELIHFYNVSRYFNKYQNQFIGVWLTRYLKYSLTLNNHSNLLFIFKFMSLDTYRIENIIMSRRILYLSKGNNM